MKLKGFLLIALAFFCSISIFITDVLIFSIVAIWLIEGQFKDKWHKVKSSYWLLSLLLLLLFYVVGLLWGNNHNGGQWIFEKSALLLILPILYTSKFSQKEIKLSLYTFIASSTFSAIIALLINFRVLKNLFKYSDIFTKNWSQSAFLVYTEHNVFLAFTLLVVLFLLIKKEKKKGFTIALSIVAILNLMSIFSENGRTGQLAVVLMLVLFLSKVLWHKKVWLFLSILGLSASISLAYIYSPSFTSRVNATLNQTNHLDKESNNSLNTRYYLYSYTLDKILENPIVGYGTGSFVEEYSSINEHAINILNDEHKTPHNNYLFIWFELGIVGLIIFLSIFYFQIKEFRTLKQGNLRIIMPIMFLLIMMTDTYIQNHNTAVLYAYISFVFSTYSFK